MTKMWAGALIFTLLSSAPAAAARLTPADKAMIRAVILDHLKDPGSAQFKWREEGPNSDGDYCGMVNAKNSYGGYIGFAQFNVQFQPVHGPGRKPVFILMGDGDPGSFMSDAVRQLCAD